MSAVAEPEQVAEVDLDAARAEVEENISRLRRAVSRLSLGAFTDSDPAVRSELIGVEGELADAEAELQRISLARAERERLAIEAQAAEQDAARLAALEVAQRLQPARAEAARAVDVAAAAHVEAVASFVSVARAQQQALRRAHQPETAHIARASGFAVEAAFARAMREAKWSGSLRGIDLWTRLRYIPVGHQRLLAESDARPVEPLED
jgi:hypothetical protein